MKGLSALDGNLLVRLAAPLGIEPSHEQGFDSYRYSGGAAEAAFDRWTWTFPDGELMVYVGAHPQRRIVSSAPPDPIASGSCPGLSFVVRTHRGLHRELYFLPACWLHVYARTESDELARALETTLETLEIEVRSAQIRCRSGGERLAREIVCEPAGDEPAPMVLASLSELRFPPTPVGARSAMAFTITAVGRFAFGVVELPPGFRLYDRFGARWLDDTVAMPIEVNDSSDLFTIAFAPARAGLHEGQVRFRHRSHPFALSVSGEGLAAAAPDFADNQTLVEISAGHLDFGVVDVGDEVSRPLILRNPRDEAVPIHLSGPDIGDGPQFFSLVVTGAARDRLSRDGLLLLRPRDEVSLEVRCHCRKSALLWPTPTLAIATPTGTMWVHLKFKVPRTDTFRGWGWDRYAWDADSDRRSLVERFDPEIEALIRARKPALRPP